MMMNRLPFWTLLLLIESVLADQDDIKEVLKADSSLHNLKACGSCKIVTLPETTPCWYTTAVVYASGCQTMGCFCDQNYRQKRTKWIKDGVQSLCGIKDTVTPQATVDWFNTFCDAQLAILPASSPAVSSSSDLPSTIKLNSVAVNADGKNHSPITWFNGYGRCDAGRFWWWFRWQSRKHDYFEWSRHGCQLP